VPSGWLNRLRIRLSMLATTIFNMADSPICQIISKGDQLSNQGLILYREAFDLPNNQDAKSRPGAKRPSYFSGSVGG